MMRQTDTAWLIVPVAMVVYVAIQVVRWWLS